MALSLEIQDLTHAYSGQAALFEGASFALRPGDALCLLGPNGAGKTTLLRCLTGLTRPTAGRILLGGIDIATLPAKAIARRIAYVPQTVPNVFAYTALDIVLMGRSPHVSFLSTPTRIDVAIARAAMDELDLGDFAKRAFADLSGGERQLVLIARALAQQSPLLILDEPTASLDFGNSARILRAVRALSRKQFTIVMTSHAPDHAMLACNSVAMLKDGKLRVLGAPSEIIDEDLLSALYDTPVRILKAMLPGPPGRSIAACVPLLED